MCWKDEWAKAINNINNAIEHIEYAQKKLEARLTRNMKNLERIKRNPKYNYPPVLAPIEARIEKNTDGIRNCREIISELRQRQALLFCMIHTIGIKRQGASSRVYKLMGNYPGKIDCEKTDCEDCPLTAPTYFPVK